MRIGWLSLIILGLFCLTLAGPLAQSGSGADTKKSTLQQKKNQLQKKIDELQKKIRPIKQQQRRMADQVKDCEDRVADARVHLGQTRSKLATAKQELAKCETRMKELETQHSNQRKLFGGRLSAYYKGDRLRFLNLLLESDSIFDLISNAYLVSVLFQADVRALDAIEITKVELETVRKKKATQAATYEGYVQDELTDLEEIKQQAYTQHAILAKISKERASWEQYMQEFIEDSQAIERQLSSYSSGYTGTLGGKWRGKLIRPCGGSVTSPFGWRIHPIYRTKRFHTGVDFGIASGTPVKAATDGRVVSAGWKGAYGRCVIIDHGGGISTVYGHLSSISVKAGQTVSKAQMVGRVGSTGLSTGPHLHFEVRENGKPVNPL